MCELNKLSDEDMVASLLFTEIGTFFITCGGWFEYLLIYRGVLFGWEWADSAQAESLSPTCRPYYVGARCSTA